MKILLFLIAIINNSLIIDSRVKDEIVFKLHQRHVVVFVRVDSADYPIELYVNCITHCCERRFPSLRPIFSTAPIYYDPYYDGITEKSIDSLFQNLYDWIKEIEEYSSNHNRYKMGYNNIYRIPMRGQGYSIEFHRSYFKIYTSRFLRDQRGYFCSWWTKMNLRNITKFKKLLLEYINIQNIRIRL